MSDSANREIEQITRSFVTKLEAAIRKSVYASLANVLGGQASEAPAPAPRASATQAPTSTPRAARGGRKGVQIRRAAPSGGGRRSPEELEELTSRVREYIQSNPGQGAEQIGSALGLRTKELALPINKLLEQRAIKRRGERRGTRYNPA